MNNTTAATDPLAQLRDIHLPAAVGWWPPAPGWWLLGSALLLLTIAALYFCVRRNTQRRYRKQALQTAKAIYSQWQQHGDNLVFVQALNRLLKQTALVAFAKQQVAALNGDAWLNFLDASLPKPQFNRPATRVLADVYQTHIDDLHADTVLSAVEYWLRRHRC